MPPDRSKLFQQGEGLFLWWVQAVHHVQVSDAARIQPGVPQAGGS